MDTWKVSTAIRERGEKHEMIHRDQSILYILSTTSKEF